MTFKHSKPQWSLATLAFTAGMAFAASSSALTLTVTPSDVNSGGDWYTADTRAPGVGTFENGPSTPPYGAGSFELNTSGGSAAKVQLFTDLFTGVTLSQIDGIGYSTYRDPASTGFEAGVAALNMRVDLDNNGTPDAYMVFEPYWDQGNAAVQTGVWQTWDAYRGGEAKWWLNTGSTECTPDTPCTWDRIVELFPNATIREGASCGPGGAVSPCPGSLGINQGSGQPGTISNADGLYVSLGGSKVTFDFELVKSRTTKDQCKAGGWQNATRADGSAFKNQGDCIQYVNTGK